MMKMKKRFGGWGGVGGQLIPQGIAPVINAVI